MWATLIFNSCSATAIITALTTSCYLIYKKSTANKTMQQYAVKNISNYMLLRWCCCLAVKKQWHFKENMVLGLFVWTKAPFVATGNEREEKQIELSSHQKTMIFFPHSRQDKYPSVNLGQMPTVLKFIWKFARYISGAAAVHIRGDVLCRTLQMRRAPVIVL